MLIRSLFHLMQVRPITIWRSSPSRAGTDRTLEMIMPAELVDRVVGIDPDRDWITVAALDSHTSGVVATDRFPASRDGRRAAIVWADAHSTASERGTLLRASGSS